MMLLRRRRQLGAGADPHPGTDLLMEDGAYFLLEDGSSTILLEV
jgi:hypothetical protein